MDQINISLYVRSCVKIFFVSKYLQSFWIARFAGGARRRISGDEVKTRGFIMDIDDGDSSLRCSGIKRVTEVQKSSRKRGKGFRCITDQMLCESHSSEENFQELRKESRKSTQVIEEKPARMEEESRSASSKFWQKDVMARQIPKERFAMIWYAAFEEEVEKGLLSALRATGGIREHSSAVRKLHVSMKRGMEETFPSRVADAGTRYWWEYTASEVFFKVMVSMLESSKDSCSRISNRLFIFFTDVIQLSGGYLRNAATRSGLRALTLKQENAVGALIEYDRASSGYKGEKSTSEE
ncbi:hypothetical protein R1sor_012153 [Riccia sorocarpa]|uniref:Uncharacterized protein n=1 Tax=Riccia sorocarpa TaxID=122646 RepID=A0ABD3I5N9_9MARC